ncbi:MAG: protein-glutamate O-methyltransferase CheR, partial [Alphaproteobacteria bacterium]
MKTEIPPSLLAAVRFLVEQRLGLRLAAHQDVSLAGALQEILARRPRIDAVSLLDRLTVEPVDGSLWQQVVARVTVGETSFFRHREWFGAIEAAVLVPLIAERRAAARRSASLWSVGCATGEEPYTLAMILHRLIPDAADWTLLLQASDVDAEALASAERGEYREWSLREIDPMARDRHFVRRRDKRSETYRLNDAIRAMVRFGYMNLADPFWPP